MHDEQNIPGLLNRRIDMKYATTITFYDVIQHIKAGEIPGFPLQADVRLLIITNFAIIEADLVDPDAAAQEINPENMKAELYKALINGVTEARNSAIIEWEQENNLDKIALINDTSYLILTNAVIIPHANPEARFQMGEMLLFTDQIVGITAGHIPIPPPQKPNWEKLLNAAENE